MKAKSKRKYVFILITLVLVMFLISAVIILRENYTDIRYSLAKLQLLDVMISYNGNYYAFHGSEGDVDEGMFLLGDPIRVTLTDENGKPYKKDITETAHLYLNDPEVKYIYFSGGSWKKVEGFR